MIARGVGLALAGLSGLLCLLSDRMTTWVARALAWVVFGVAGYRRRVLAENLEAAFPELSLAERRTLGLEVGRHLAQTLLEVLRMPRFARRGFDAVEFHGLEHYENAHAQGRGVLVLAGHLGSFELTAAAVSHAVAPTKLWLVVKSFPGPVDRFVNELRRRGGTDVIPAKGALRRALEALRRGENVAFVLDQHAPGASGVTVDFFGRPAQTLGALALMALRTRAPVLPAIAYRRPDGRHVLEVYPAIPIEGRASRAETVRHMTQVYTRFLEERIRAHPAQWFWTHRRWKAAAPALVSSSGSEAEDVER